MKKVSCPLCVSDELVLITRKVRFDRVADVYACRSCGMIFLDQRSFVFPDDFYQKHYHQTYITHIEPAALNPQVYYEKMKLALKPWADRFRQMLSGNEVVLDIGCSTGHFIDLVKDKTRNIYGYELNQKEVAFCRDVLGLNVSDQPLELRFKEKSFDYILMIYVLEHIADPKNFLLFVKNFLKPSGKLIILIPNAQDALLNFFDIPEYRNFYYCIEHLYYYTPATVKLLFDAAGLRGSIEVLQEYPLANHLNWAYRHKPSDTLASRRGLPDIALSETTGSEGWSKLWDSFSEQYKQFLKNNNYGDRIWCVLKGK